MKTVSGERRTADGIGKVPSSVRDNFAGIHADHGLLVFRTVRRPPSAIHHARRTP
jgi:hypothetical protein